MHSTFLFQMAITAPTNTEIISFSNLKAASSNSLFLFTKETYLCLLIIWSFKKHCCLFASSKTHHGGGRGGEFLLLLQVLKAKYSNAL